MTGREDGSAKGVEKSRMSEVFFSLSFPSPLCCGGDSVFVKTDRAEPEERWLIVCK